MKTLNPSDAAGGTQGLKIGKCSSIQLCSQLKNVRVLKIKSVKNN